MNQSQAEGTQDFADWYATTFPRVRRAVALAVGDFGLAEEATAEAFARAFLHWRTVQDARRPEAWVYRVALNLTRSRIRRIQLERRWLQRQRLGQHPAPDEPQTELWTALTLLPPRTRTAVALRYLADLTEAEVAEAMGITRGAVAATLHKARARLRELLAAQGISERTPS